MTQQGIILINLLGLGLLVFIVNLVRTDKLYVGYALVWLFSVVGLMVIVTVEPLLELVTRVVGALFPVSALSLLAFLFIFLVLVSFSVQLTSISNKQIELIQAYTMKELLEQEKELQQEGNSNGS